MTDTEVTALREEAGAIAEVKFECKSLEVLFTFTKLNF